MKKIVMIGLLTLLTGCSGLRILDSTVSRSGYVRQSDLAYGVLPRQRLDLYRPANLPNNAPVVVFFYGGGWRLGRKEQYRYVAKALTERGFVVVVPDYRLYPEVTFPAFVEDGASATRWAHDHVTEFGGDPNRLYLMGHSAGAHIAALLTLDAHYLAKVGLSRSAIRATAGLSGPYDFVPGPAYRPIFDLKPGEPTGKMEPIAFVDGQEPPMLLIQGLRDTILDPGNTTRLAARIREKGGSVEEIVYPRRAHLTVVLAFARPFRWLAPVLEDVTQYFERH